MSELRWSDELDAVVNENDTIVYVVSSEVGAMIVGYQRQKDVIRTQTTVSARQVALIADLRAALTDAQSVASEQCRLRAEVEGKLTEATTLLEHSDKRITELEAIVYRQAELLDEKGYTQQEAMLRFQQKRITELERQLTAIEVAASDGRLYAEGCAP